MKPSLTTKVLLATALFTSSVPSFATENGGTVVPVGVQSVLPGMLAAPGTYLYNYNAYVKGFSARDEHGDDTGMGLKMATSANAFRFLHVFDENVLGNGNLAFETSIVYTDNRMKMHYVGDSRNSGISDITFGPSLGRHFGSYNDIFVLLFTAPTGDYDKNRLANVGRNYWGIQGSYAWTWYPMQNWDVSGLFKVIYNTENEDTHYQSGMETNFEYSSNYYFSNGMFVGVGGFWHGQFTDDKQNGHVVGENGNKVNEIALGPQVGWGTPQYGAYFSWKRSVLAKNTMDISQLWLNTFLTF
ncbi:hypothetical protein EDF88_1027 [Buttiauxella sp. BIGb0552]|uniref:SphA family protein n=1 Tax=Buttiauxella sp. BIGb0552 TaxID=2485120 RepID=UPI00106552D1|nr:transporter [Buttiauxella sp. BIGb0552]TDX18541.1 hypothetical protein EDF88_1027 [Buttiauxella sp. BIGb0552]